MAVSSKLSTPKAYIITFLKWGLFGLLMGVWGGLLGAAFHHALHFVTHLRESHNWLIFLLPAGGLLSGQGGLHSSQMQIFQKTSTNPLSQDFSQS